jgi:hypothetical protein
MGKPDAATPDGLLDEATQGRAARGTAATDVTTDKLIAEMEAIQKAAPRSPGRALA